MTAGDKKILKSDVIVALVSLGVGAMVYFSVTREQGIFDKSGHLTENKPKPPVDTSVKKDGGKTLNDPSLPPNVNRAYAIFNQATAEEKEGNYTAAIGHYVEACRIDPIRKMYWSGLGSAYMHENKFEQAIDAFMEVYNRDVYDTFNLSNLGFASQSLRRDADAMRYYLMALTIQPDLPDAWAEMYNVAHGLVLMSYYDEIKDMARAPAVTGNSDLIYRLNQTGLDMHPDDYYYLVNRAFLNLRFMRLSTVEADVDRALSIQKNGPAALLARAQLYSCRGEFDRAAEAYKACLAVSPQPVAYAELGTIQMQQGKLDEALHSYGKATELGNDKPSWLATYNRLRAEKMKRDKAGAIAQDKSGAK